MANPYMGGYNYGQYYNPLQPQMDRLAQMQAQYQQRTAAGASDQSGNLVGAGGSRSEILPCGSKHKCSSNGFGKFSILYQDNRSSGYAYPPDICLSGGYRSATERPETAGNKLRR